MTRIVLTLASMITFISGCVTPGLIGDIDTDTDESVHTDTDTVECYFDGDRDGYGDPADSQVVKGLYCPNHYVTRGTDCDDGWAGTHPGAAEECGDNADNDCDGTVDENCGDDDEDRDGDGYEADIDCDDGDEDINPGADEDCDDGVDNDCDGKVDDDDSECDGDVDTVTCYFDADGDGYGDADDEVEVEGDCPNHYVDNDDDCDDGDDDINPGADEDCDDGVDNDCDGKVDDDDSECDGDVDTVTCYDDDDGDGYGDATQSKVFEADDCDDVSGYVDNDDDCDDGDDDINPGADEDCDDGVDNDCDGDEDDDDSECDADTVEAVVGVEVATSLYDVALWVMSYDEEGRQIDGKWYPSHADESSADWLEYSLDVSEDGGYLKIQVGFDVDGDGDYTWPEDDWFAVNGGGVCEFNSFDAFYYDGDDEDLVALPQSDEPWEYSWDDVEDYWDVMDGMFAPSTSEGCDAWFKY